MANVIIVVPIYKVKLNVFEQISWKQLNSILGSHAICIVAPESLCTEKSCFERNMIERFSDEYFKDINGYNNLMLSPEFYKRFEKYEYMMLYQLDAFVFSDKLNYFCSLGYDYIGAPWPYIFLPRMGIRVGNGGFSLRKIATFIRVLPYTKSVKDEIISKGGNNAEDLRFSFLSKIKDLCFNIPNIKTATSFALEYNVLQCFQKLSLQLPFGCHKWYSENFDIWWPIVQKYGYSVDNADINDLTSAGSGFIQRYLCKRLTTVENRQKLQVILPSIMDVSIAYSVWGYGKDGKSCVALLLAAGIKINAVYDKNLYGRYTKNGIKILYPSNENLFNETVIIIATRNNERVIRTLLEDKKKVEGQDYISWKYLQYNILNLYRQSLKFL